MGIIDTRVGRIGVDERGGGEALPILFLHGVGSDKSVWRPQLEYFGGTRRALALDYPGYGESEPGDAGGHDAFAAAVLAAMDALGVAKAHLCGLSLGGVVAIALHAAAPHRCASLVLADSFAVHPEGGAIYQRSIEASWTMTMRALAEARVDVLLGRAASAKLRAEVIETMAAIEPDAYRVAAAAVWLADQRARAEAVAVPALVLCGTEDRVTPPALSDELAALVPGARLAMIEGAGHLANAEQPDAFNKSTESFISEVERNMLS